MNSQGLWGAIYQYWNISDKPRLDRENTYFEDHKVSNASALRVGLAVSLLATAIVVLWSVGGIL